MKPVAYINVEERKLEWAKPTTWHTPTIAQMEKIPLYTHPTKTLTDEEIFKQGFMAGFAISAEGWNAEYPFRHGEPTDFTKDKFVLKKLQQAIKAQEK